MFPKSNVVVIYYWVSSTEAKTTINLIVHKSSGICDPKTIMIIFILRLYSNIIAESNLKTEASAKISHFKVQILVESYIINSLNKVSFYIFQVHWHSQTSVSAI